MSWFHNLKISKKLLLSFMTLALVITGLGFYTTNSLDNMAKDAGHMYTNDIVPLGEIASIQGKFNHLRVVDFEIAATADPGKLRTYSEMEREDVAEIKKNINQFESGLDNEKEREEFSHVVNAFEEYQLIRMRFKQVKAATPEKALDVLLEDETIAAGKKVISQIEHVTNEKLVGGKSYYDDLNEIHENTQSTLTYIIILSIIFAISLGLIISNIITKPLSELTDLANKISDGDLTKRLDNASRDEIGDLTRNVNQMADQLTALISQIKKSSLQLASASDEISASSEQVARGAEAQSTASEETSTTIVEIASQIENVAKSSQSLAANVNEIASTIDEMSATTNLVADKVKAVDGFSKNTVSKTQESSKELVDIIKRIEQKSIAVENIIKLIEDIADQTNLLALNASIEAAWAGESGKGFAVVAEAIRNLAERSVSATKEISNVVLEVKKETSDASTKVELIVGEVVKNVTETSGMLGSVATAVVQQSAGATQIVKSVEYMNRMTQEVAIATKEQQNGSSMIVKAVDNISISSKQNLQSVQQLARAASDLAAEAETLKTQTEKFRL